MKNKKAVSVVIGYILLIAFGVIMSIIVYNYLKTYVPKDSLSCPNEVSIFIKEIECNSSTGNLSLRLKNNGNFNLEGYFIYGTTNISQELAVQDLSIFLNNNTGPIRLGNSVAFSSSKNSLPPNEEIFNNFSLGYQIYSIEVIPTRFQGQGIKEKLISCSDARVKQELTCWQ
jgi:hypothetical protein